MHDEKAFEWPQKNHYEKRDQIQLRLIENNEKEIVLVEWPQIIKEVPKNVTKLYFEYKNDFKDRCIKIIQ